MKAELAAVYRRCRAREYADIAAGKLAKPVHDPEAHAETMRRIKTSGDYFTEIPLLMFVFAIDDDGGANIYPAIWSALLAARGRGRRPLLRPPLFPGGGCSAPFPDPAADTA